MKHQRTVRTLLAVLVCLLSAQGLLAQHTETRVHNAEVVYVEGNDVVMKLPGGELKQFELAENSSFTIDGKNVTVHELQPGMKVTATITTATPPRQVVSVKVVAVGTVWKTVGTSLIIRTPEGENKMYRVPSGGKVVVDGKVIALDQLHEGDKITATVITTKAPAEGTKGSELAAQTPATPPRVGALLIDEGAKPGEEGARQGEPSGTWGTSTIIILIAIIALVALLILLALRRKKKA